MHFGSLNTKWIGYLGSFIERVCTANGINNKNPQGVARMTVLRDTWNKNDGSNIKECARWPDRKTLLLIESQNTEKKTHNRNEKNLRPSAIHIEPIAKHSMYALWWSTKAFLVRSAMGNNRIDGIYIARIRIPHACLAIVYGSYTVPLMILVLGNGWGHSCDIVVLLNWRGNDDER